MHSVKHAAFWLSLALVMLAMPGFAQQEGTTHPDRTVQGKTSSEPPVKAVDETDKRFMKHAAIGDAAEIGLGQMAQEKASNPDVKSFGERMVKDHSQNDDLLKNVAETQHINLPTSLDEQHKAAKGRLSRLTGSKFDQAYMQLMVQEHTKTVHQFQQEASNAHDPAVKKYAKESLPVLESHLKEAKEVNSKINGNK